jgi:hypothetical protein
MSFLWMCRFQGLVAVSDESPSLPATAWKNSVRISPLREGRLHEPHAPLGTVVMLARGGGSVKPRRS